MARSRSRLTPGAVVLANALAAFLSGTTGTRRLAKGVAQPEVVYTTTPPFDDSPAARKARALRREARLKVLKPIGMTSANHIMKPDVANLIAVAEKIGAGAGSKAERTALDEVLTRVRNGSLRFTDGAKVEAGKKPFAFIEHLETLAQLA
jgi:hypothetical protein